MNDRKKKQHEKNAFVKGVWKLGSALKGEKSVNMMTIASLVRVSKLNNVKKEKIWQALSRHRWSADILNSGCLDENQTAEVIRKTGEELSLMYGPNVTWTLEEDLPFVIELYSTLHHCPDHLKEAAQLSVFFESLVTEHNLNTVVASTMHNIQPRVGDNIRDLSAINMWYERLDEKYNLSLGPAILGMMTTDNLMQLAELNPPYLKEYEASINAQQYENLTLLFGKILYIHVIFSLKSDVLCQGITHTK